VEISAASKSKADLERLEGDVSKVAKQPEKKPMVASRKKKTKKKKKKKHVLPDHLHHKHNHGILGKRVRVTHAPGKDKASKTLVYKSGLVVKTPATTKKVEVLLDDSRRISVGREFLAFDRNPAMHPVDIWLKAGNLKKLDL
jgi:hypothetical protein